MLRRGGWKVFLAIPAAVFATVAWANAQEAKKDEKKADKPKNIVEIAKADASLKMFVELLGEAELTDTLMGPGPFTVFAPNDAAFAKLSKEDLAALKADKGELKNVLLHHVVKGAHDAAAVGKMTKAKTEHGPVTVTAKDKDVMFGAAKVIKADIKAGNGFIHIIDTVEMPKKAMPG